MSYATRGAQGEPAPQVMREALAAMLQEHGETATIQRLGIGRQTLARILGGMTVRRGTLALVCAALSAPETPKP